jgi:glycosyltransferase involved in cell wall biosynthesis
MTPLRIAHVTARFVPVSYGGAEVHCAELARRQREQGHEVIVITNEPGATFADPHVRNLDVAPRTLQLALLFAQRSIDRRLADELAAFAPDVVHVHNVHQTLGIGAYRVASRYPTVATMHDYHLFCLRTDNSRFAGNTCNDRSACARCARSFYPAKAKEAAPSRARAIDRAAALGAPLFALIPPLRNSFRERWFDAWVDAAIVPSEAVRTTMLRWGVPGERIETIGSIIAEPASPGESGPLGATTPIFGFIGRLAENKGVRLLLEAFRRATRPDRPLRLRIAGDGPEAASLHAAAAGLDGVAFLGRLERDRVDEFYESVDAIVVPSLWPEPAPLVVLEAMARGRVPIVADIGGMPDQIGDAGLTATSNDADALAAALRRISDTPGRADELGARARARFETQLAPSLVLERHEALYRRTIARRGERP